MARDSFIQEAFEQICKDAKPAHGFYVTLMEEQQVYAGPEEGGWHTSDFSIVAYKWFATEEEAVAACEAAKRLAAEMSEESRRGFGLQCRREMDWLEARGLDADFLPEPDGESKYHVVMSEGLPQESRGCRQYS